MDISVIGAGYVGLGTAIGLLGNGHRVKFIERDEQVVASLNKGIAPLYERGLSELISEYLTGHNDRIAYTDYHETLDTDVSFVCVPTPNNPDGSIFLSDIDEVIQRLGEVLSGKDQDHLVIIKSSVVPGTTDEFIIPLLEKTSGKKIGSSVRIAVNPEFLSEGNLVQLSTNPYRIVIGTNDEETGDLVEGILEKTSAPVVRTDIRTAEMIKYASNAFLATRVSFINEVGNICREMGIDVDEVARGMGHDPRIGHMFLKAGIGFGGSCLPKDLDALIHRAGELGYRTELLNAVLSLNREQVDRFVAIARGRLGGIEGKVIAVLGLAFKPNTDDVRNAPAIEVINRLLAEGSQVKVYDPQAMNRAREVLFDKVQFCHSAANAIDDTDCVMITTEWNEFRDENLYAGRLVIDGRRVLDPRKAKKLCDYEGICW